MQLTLNQKQMIGRAAFSLADLATILVWANSGRRLNRFLTQLELAT